MPNASLTPRAVVAAISMVLLLSLTALQPVAAISNGSSLAFLTQPATTTVGTTITSVFGDPNGSPRIRVAIFNGSGDRERIAGIPIRLEIVSGTGAAGASLSGAVASTNDEGVATFEPAIDTRGFDYQLVARAADTGSVSSGNIAASQHSDRFDIQGDIADCSGTDPCQASDAQAGTAALISADADGLVIVAVGVGGLNCAGYAESSETVTFDVTEGIEGTRTLVRIELQAASVSKPARKFDVCFSSPESSFTDKSGIAVATGEAGLLADCPRRLVADGDACVVSREKDRAGNVIVTFSVPLGDPRGVI